MGPAVARLRLRRMLRQAREAAGHTQAGAAEALGVSQSKIVRVEAGEVKVSIPDVRALLAEYGATDRLDEAEQLVREAKGRSWTGDYRKVLTAGDMACCELEPAAISVSYLDLHSIPVLLRTEEYARMFVAGSPLTGGGRRLLVEAWMRRQQLFADPPPLRFFLDESLLYRFRHQDAPMVDRQVKHILDLAEHPKVIIRVVPLAVGLRTVHSITMLELGDETLVWRENSLATGLVREEDPDSVRQRRETLDWCDQVAVPLAQAVPPAAVESGGR